MTNETLILKHNRCTIEIKGSSPTAKDRIVRAITAHADLLKAAKLLLAWHDESRRDQPSYSSPYGISAARDAIAYGQLERTEE